MSTPEEQRIRLDEARLELDKSRHEHECRIEDARLRLEQEKDRHDRRVMTRHLGTFVTAVVSLAAVIVSLSQVYNANLTRRAEQQSAAAREERDLKLRAIEFVAGQKALIFSQDPEERALFARLMLAAFPASITQPIFERLESGADPGEKAIWADAGAAASKQLFAPFNPEEYVDPTYQEEGMKACPKGFALGGMNVRDNRVTCRRVIASTEIDQIESIVDGNTQRDRMHACPSGMYVRGYHDEKNLLLCSRDVRRSREQFTEAVDTGTQNYGMHVCPSSPVTVMTGINAGENRFLCGRSPTQ